MSPVPVRKRNAQQGSALLIVFLFAAMIAIALYTEMPVAVFESQREKEQLLIDRGNEYTHAVKLYYKKFGSYPGNMEQLENTNRLRFLRHKYKDPFTGNDDWRLLHAGPGGMLIDSKVKTLKNVDGSNAQGNQASNTNGGFGSNSNSSFGSSSFGSNNSSFGSSNSSFGSNSSSFGSSSFGSSNSGFGNNSNSRTSSFGSGFSSNSDNSSNDTGDGPTVAALPQRRSAMPMNRANRGTAPTGDANGGQDPSMPGTDPSDPANEAARYGLRVDQSSSGNNAQPSGQAMNSSGQAAMQSMNGQTGGTTSGPNSMDNNQAMRNLMNNPNPVNTGSLGQTATQQIQAQQQQSSSFGSSSMGRLNNGGLAGVASKAKGHTIKVVNDQTDYSLWEFYYDPTKDLTNLGGANAQQSAQQGVQATQSGFRLGSTGTNSSFGQNAGSSNSPNQNPASQLGPGQGQIVNGPRPNAPNSNNTYPTNPNVANPNGMEPDEPDPSFPNQNPDQDSPNPNNPNPNSTNPILSNPNSPVPTRPQQQPRPQ